MPSSPLIIRFGNVPMLLLLFSSAFIAVCIFFGSISEAVPLPLKKSTAKQFLNDKSSAHQQQFWTPSASGDFLARELASPRMFFPYADGVDFGKQISMISSAEEEQEAAAKRSNAEGGHLHHFVDPYDGGWLSIGEPNRLEWNFNRLR